MKTKFQNQIRLMILLMLTLFISASWAQTTLSVTIRTSEGFTVPDAETAELGFYIGGGLFDYTTLVNDGSGNFEVPLSLLSSTPLEFRMSYHCGVETRFLSLTTPSPVEFVTYTFTVIIRNPENTGDLPGTYTHRTSSYSPVMPTGTICEVLPGWHYLNVWFHTGQVTRDVWVTTDNHVEYFNTTTILPRLIDCEGIVAQSLEDPSWHLWHGCVGPCDGCPFNQEHPALVGSEQRFRVFYNLQVVADETFIVPATPLVLTMAVPCTFSFRTFPNTIGILVWHDADGDGTQTGEQNLGIAGVTVKLTKPNGTLLMTGVTNALGIVTFQNYPMNQPMKVRFILPNGYEFTSSSGSIFNPMNSDASNNGNTNAFQGTGEFIGFIDCGLVYSAAKTSSVTYSEELSLYPNPASGVTSLTYYLCEDANVNIRAFDLAGKEVAIFDEGMKAAGQNTSEFDVSTLEPGIYFVKFVVGDNVRTERIVVTR